jgi:hypothetical protein
LSPLPAEPVGATVQAPVERCLRRFIAHTDQQEAKLVDVAPGMLRYKFVETCV